MYNYRFVACKTLNSLHVMCASLGLPGAWLAPVSSAPGRPVRPLILYSTNWGHYQYPFAPDGRRTCQASVCLIKYEYLDAVGMCVLVGGSASGALVRPMGANTTQYHPIPPNTTPIPPSIERQYHPRGRPAHAKGSMPMSHPEGAMPLRNAHRIHTSTVFVRALTNCCVGFVYRAQPAALN